MKTIHKFPLRVTGQQFVHLPVHAKILAAQAQDGVLCLWAEVQPESLMVEARSILVYATGHQMLHVHARYIDTVQMGALVWHVYEELKP